MDKLIRRLGYHFQDANLYRQALTHRSVSNTNNERLEFLGDAILGFLIAEELYRRFPMATEGEMSRLRASLVKGQTLAMIAAELELGEYILLGSGELKSGGFRRDSILACTLEALIGAVYLDGGETACRALVRSLFSTRLDQNPLAGIPSGAKIAIAHL
jgi:ribonuclease-3